MPDNEIGLEAIFENEDFQRGVSDYNSAVSDATRGTEDAGGIMSGVWDNLAVGGEIAFSAIAAGVAAAAAAVVAAAGTITAIVFDAADAAGELVDLSTKTGISVTSLQELTYVGDQVGTSLETMTGAMARLTRSMDTAREEQGKFDEQLAAGVMEDEIKVPTEMAAAFNGLGVAFTDASGNLRNQQDVFMDIIDALEGIENPAERDALAMQIFGKSAQELNPLIKAGSDELARLAQEAHDMGAVMDEDAVFALEAFGDTMTSIQAGLKGILGRIAVQALPAFEALSSRLQELFQSEEFQQRIDEVGRIIGNIATFLADNFEIIAQRVGDFVGNVVDNIPNIIDSIQRIPDWFKENRPLIVGILSALGVAIAAFAFTVISSAISAAVALAPILLAMAVIGAGAALLYTAWTENWGGIQEHVMALWQTIQPIFQSLIDWLQVNVPIALAYLSELWSTVLLPAIQAVFSWIVANLIPLWISIIEWLQVNIPAAISALSEFWTGTLLPAIESVWSWISTNLIPLFEALANLFNAVLSLAITALAGLWQNVLLPAIRQVGDWISQNLLPIFTNVSQTINDDVMPALRPLAEFLKNVLAKAFEAISEAIQTVIGWINSLTEAFNNVVLPEALTPGSPTPFEIGLKGINEQLSRLARATLPRVTQELSVLAQVRDVPGANGSSSALAGRMVSSTSNVNNYLFGARFNVDSSSGLLDILAGLST